MNDLRVCTKGVGFAVVGALTTAVLTVGSYGQGGDNAGSATPILNGVVDTGTTIGYINDSDEVCPYTGSTSPDVWYTYTSGTGSYNVSLCESGYDTKVYCYDQNFVLLSTTDGSSNGIACNDDECSSSGGGGFRSLLTCVEASGAGDYIVVDGWGGSAGDYEILVTDQDPVDCGPPPPCIAECPPGGTLENEPCNYGSSGFDNTNGGCNSSPPVFSDLLCDTVYCGDSYFDGAFRDTDWWALDNSANDLGITYTITGLASFNSVYGRVDNGCGALDCSQVAAFAEVVVSAQCDPISLSTPELANCLAWFFVGTDFSQIVDCNQPAGGPPNEVGDSYVLEVICVGGTPPCPWDINGDGQVGFADLLSILSNWGPCPM